MIRACYGRCESLTAFQCQVVENEAWPQTDRSLELPPVCLFEVSHRCEEKPRKVFDLRGLAGGLIGMDPSSFVVPLTFS